MAIRIGLPEEYKNKFRGDMYEAYANIQIGDECPICWVRSGKQRIVYHLDQSGITFKCAKMGGMNRVHSLWDLNKWMRYHFEEIQEVSPKEEKENEFGVVSP